ncbi:hypothetical protein G1C95_1409 [Bifidobacterium sp. DSM 109957]|uniref:Lipoprotein n=1 Tax=Bifidobacterium oedipodis TaxID=2675322 RepID=A0A7Y0EPY4_9BIFI|nr:hypothetical protein [Bifidobacterium sp. DSM 109957]
MVVVMVMGQSIPRRSRHKVARSIISVVTCAALLMMVAACGGEASAAKNDGATAQSDDVGRLMNDGLGEKAASSLSEYIDQSMRTLESSQQMKEFDPSGEATQRILKVLERAKEQGRVSVSDYESAWADYKQCMADRGYKEIVLIKEPNGIYKEASHRAGTAEQDARYGQDMLACGATTYSSIADVYKMQIGNPNLYKNQYEAALDCLHRNEAAPKDYSMDDLRFDLYEAASKDELKLDIYTPEVSQCLVANNITVFSDNSVTEQLW